MACKYIYKSKEYTLDEIKNDLENILSENKLSKDELLFKKVNPVLAFQLEDYKQYLNESDFDSNGNVKPEVLAQIESEKQSIISRTKADGTFMKAPNGQKTNLNEDQWINVRTERFKNWFGDWENDIENASKVIDENGEPMIVYHGTNKVFSEFKSNSGLNFFTTDKIYAWSYSVNKEGSKTIMDLFLDIKNPIKAESISREILKNNESNINDGYIGLDNGTSSMSFVTKNPNQIKSAESNQGTYSSENNNINFQVEAQQTEMIPSVLFEQLRQQPFITSEQALEAYKNIYTDSVGDWQSSEMNC